MQSYLVDLLLGAAVDITARAALAEKTGEQVAQREQATVSVITAHNRLFAGADGRVAAGLFAAGFLAAGLVGSVRWDSESRGSQERKDEEELHGDGLTGELERYVSKIIKSERVLTIFFL